MFQSMWWRFALFFTLLFGVLLASNLAVYRRASFAFRLSPRNRRITAIFLGFSLLAMVAGRALTTVLPAESREPIARIGSVTQLGVLLSAILLLPEWFIRKLVAWRRNRTEAKPSTESGRHRAATAPTSSPQLPTAPTKPAASPFTRRQVLARACSGTALGLGGGSAIYGGFFGRHDYHIEEVPIRLAKLPRSLDGFVIAQLSDIHLGLFVHEPAVLAAIELVRKIRPDQIVLTGDLIDHDARYVGLLGRLLRRLGEVAPVAVIPGNHDYYSGIASILTTAKRADAEVLVNRSIMIGDAGAQFALVGVDDIWGRRTGRSPGPRLDKALETVPPWAARILLCHNPAFFPEAASDIDLQLSGHTHGGQVNLGIRPAALILPHGYVAGYHTRGNAQLYINRGFGTAGPPVRIGAPPEVTKVVLTS